MSLLRKFRKQLDQNRKSQISLEPLENRLLLNADLDIAAFSIDSAAPYHWGDNLNLTTNIQNIGSVDSGAFDMKMILSQDAIADAGDIELGTMNQASIVAGGSAPGNPPLTLPASGTDGAYHLILQVDTGDVVVENDEGNNQLAVPLSIATDAPPPPADPDLTVSSFTISETGPYHPGDNITLNDTIDNTTSNTSPGFDVTYVLSTDATLDLGDIILGSRTVGGVGGNANDIGSTPITIPAGVAPGSYHIGAVADSGEVVTEINENNNTFGFPITIDDNTPPPAAGADLVPDQFIVNGATTFNWGDGISINADIRNSGDTASGAFDVKILLSQDATPDASDILLDTLNITDIAAGGVSANPLSLTLPATGTDGDYQLIMEIDASNGVTESNETNNVINVAGISIGSGSPPPAGGIDISVDPVTLPAGQPAWGDTMNFNVTLKNTGDTDVSGPFDVEVILSSDAIPDAGDTVLTTFNVASLTAGGTSNQAVTATLPATGTDGPYHIIIKADSAAAITETDENNNIFAGPVAIGANGGGGDPPASGIDLEIAPNNGFDIDSPGPFTWGDTINVAADIKNIGSDAATSFDVEFYLSQDSVKDAGDTLLDTLTVTSMLAGATSENDVILTLPASGTDGAHHLLMVIDSGDTNTETNETNNFGSVPFNIGDTTGGGGDPPTNPVTGIDIIVDPITLPAAPPAWGDILSFNVDVKNLGDTAASGPFDVELILSTDATSDASDTSLGTFTVNTLASGAVHTEAVTITLPATGTDGSYHIIAKADSGEVITEADETNNVFAATVQVGATGGGDPGGGDPPAPVNGIDLIVDPFDSVPQGTTTAPLWGETLTLAIDIKNTGDADAVSPFDVEVYLSSDATADGTDTLLTTFNVATLTAGSVSNNSITVTLPATGTDGNYHIVAKADSADVVLEADENNNVFAAPIAIGATATPPDPGGDPGTDPGGDPGTDPVAGIDIIVDPFEPMPAGTTTAPLWGDTLNFTVDLKNIGDTNITVPFDAEVWLSSDASLDATDTLLTTFNIPTEADLLDNPLTVTLPASGTDGAYHLIVKADSGDVVTEADENNNIFSAPLSIGATVTPPDPGGDPGGDPGTDPGGDPGNQPPVEGIDIGVAPVEIFDAVNPPTTAPLWGDTLSFEVDIFNNGTQDVTAPFDVELYLSSTQTGDPVSDTLLTTFNVAALTAGSDSHTPVTITLPATGTDGNYYIIAKADSGEVITEADEQNNVSSSPIAIGATVEPPDPGGDPGGDPGTDPGGDPGTDPEDPPLTEGVDIMVDHFDVFDPLNPPAAAPLWGDTVTFAVEIFNNGLDAVPSAFDAEIYLSSSPDGDPSDTLLTTLSVPALASDADFETSVTVTLPATGTDGNYYIVIKADTGDVISESDETNNIHSSPIAIGETASPPDPGGDPGTDPGGDPGSGPQGVDLVADDEFLFPPVDLVWGQQYTLPVDIVNEASDSAGPFNVKIVLSSDAVMDAADTVLADFSVPAIGGFGDSENDVDVTLPIAGELPDGVYTVIFAVDTDDAVVELDELNNTYMETVTIGSQSTLPAGIDLELLDFGLDDDEGDFGPPNDGVIGDPEPATQNVLNSTSDVFFWGEQLETFAQIINKGDTDAGSFTVTVALSIDGQLDATDTILAEMTVPSLASGTVFDEDVNISLPAVGELPDGPYNIITVVDSADDVQEINEDNNSGFETIFIGQDVAAPTDAPDLVGDSLSFGSDPTSGPATWGDVLNLTASLSNTGTQDANSFTVQMYLSQTPNQTPDSQLLGNFTIFSLAQGETTTKDVTVNLPPEGEMPNGEYYVVLVVDSEDTNQEIDEFNNFFSAPLQIGDGSIEGVDLVADNEHFLPPVDLIWGQTYDMPIDLTNEGNAASGPFDVKIFLSTDNVVDTTDTELASLAITDLAANAESINDVDVTLPAAGTLPDGDYNIIIFVDSGEVVTEVDEQNNIFSELIKIVETPDLIAGVDLSLIEFGIDHDDEDAAGAPAQNNADGTTGDFTESFGWGDTLDLFADVVNFGDTAAGSFSISVALSVDSEFDSTDTILAETTIASLDPAGISKNDFSVTLPAAGELANGSYHIVAKVDSADGIEEIDELNNIRFTPVFIGENEVDLKIGTVFLPPEIFASSFIEIDAQIQNIGNGPVNQPFNVTVFISEDDTINDTDFIIGQKTFNSLAPQEDLQTLISIDIPPQDQFTSTNLFLGVKVDGFDSVDETSETNNTFITPITLAEAVAPTGVDVAVPYVNVPQFISAGQEIDVTYGVDNFGGTAVDSPFDVSFYLSQDPVIDVDEQGVPLSTELLLGTATIDSIAAGTFTENDISLTIPNDINFGFYHVVAIADMAKTLDEQDTFNNTGIGFTEALGDGSDLKLFDVIMPFDAAWGQEINVEAMVENFGANSADNVDVSFYQSTDFNFDAATDTLLATTTIPTINGGEIFTATTTITLPDGEGDQFITIIAVVDPSDAIEEDDELNNVMARDVFIGTPEQPNLLAFPVPIFNPGEDNVDWGDSLNVDGIINNFSNVSVNPFSVTYYLSSDEQLDGADTELGSFNVDGMTPFENLNQNVALTLPSTSLGAQNEWYLLAKADGNDDIDEFDENDNVGWSPIFVGSKPADLGGFLQTNIDPTASAVWGDTITLTGQIDNFGGSDAGAFDVKYYLSNDPEIDGNDILVGTQNVASLAANSNTPVLTSITLPTDPGDLGTGTVFVIAEIDADNTVTEFDEFNNFMGDWLTTDSPSAELVGFEANAGFDVAWGQEATINYGLGNFGISAASNFDVSFYVTTPGTPAEQGLLIGTANIANLDPDEEIFQQLTVTMPTEAEASSLLTGQANGFDLVMKVDSGDVVTEAIEENNTFFMPIRIEALKGEMDITDTSNDTNDRMIEMGTLLLGGDPLTHSFTITNNGEGSLDINEVISSATEFVVSGGQLPATIAPEGSLTFNVVFTPATQGFFQGNIEVKAADGSSEFINVFADVASAPVDLAVSSVTTDKDANWGDTISVTVNLDNLDAGSVEGGFIDIALSNSPEGAPPVAGDPGTPGGPLDNTADNFVYSLLNQPLIEAIEGNSSNTLTFDITLPQESPFGFGGELFLVVNVNASGGTFDTNFENNDNNASIEISTEAIGKPDIHFTEIFLPEEVLAGSTFDMEIGVRNSGLADAGAFGVSYYFSTDDILDDADLLLGSNEVPGLSPLSEKDGQLQIELPATAVDGLNFIIVQADSANAVDEDFEDNNTAVARFLVGAPVTLDLTADALIVPSEATVGEEFDFTLDISNTSDDAVDDVRVEFFLSDNQDTDGFLGFFLGSINGPLDATSTLSFDLNGFMPHGIVEAGENYYVKALVDADDRFVETDELNNLIVSTTPIVASAGDMDLTATINDAPTTATWAENLDVNVTLSNTGTKESAPFFMDVFLSQDGQLDPTDFYLTSQVIFGLEPGDQTLDLDLLLPQSLPDGDGSYQLLINIDGDETVAETDETNNLISQTIAISGTPDLQMMVNDIPATGNFGQVITVADEVFNVGLSDAAAFDISYYFSSDNVFDGADTLLTTRSVTALASQAVDGAQTDVTLPATGTAGDYFIIAVADQADVIVESGEDLVADGETQSNNISTAPIEILSKGFADLKPTAVSTVEESDWGETIVVQNTIKNIGTTSADEFEVTFFLSDNKSITTRDYILGTRTISELDSNKENIQSTVLTLPAENPFGEDGDFYIGILVDSDGTVAESNDENNIIVSTDTVAIGNVINVDLVASFVEVPPFAVAGEDITFYNEVYNSGTSAAGAFTVDFYLISNDETQTETLLGSRNLASLGGGEFDAGEVTLTVPESLSGSVGQTFSVEMRVNSDSAVEEKTSENNKVLSFSNITLEEPITIDVSAISITGDTTANWGDTVTATYQLNGSGEIDGSIKAAVYLSQDGTTVGASKLTEFSVEDVDGTTGNLSLILPESSPFGRDGDFQLIIVADSDDALKESDETNNQQQTTINIGSGKSDLFALEISGIPQVAAGETFEAFNSVSNYGSIDTTNFDVYFYLTSTNTSVDTTNDTLLGSRSITALTAGNVNWTMTDLSVPANVEDGDYYIAMVVDRFDDVDETSETNNTIYSTNPLKVKTVTVNPDSNEPDNTTGTATTMTVNSGASEQFAASGNTTATVDEISASIHNNDDVDYFEFTTPSTANGFGRITVDPDETLNAAVLVYDNNGTLIGGSDVSPDFGGEEVFSTFELAPGRTYSIMVKPMGESFGEYTIDVEMGLGTAGDVHEGSGNNETQDDAKYLGSEDVELEDPNIHTADDTDFYQFAIPATSDGTVEIDLNPDPTLDAVLQVYDDQGNLVASSDAAGADGAESLIIEGDVGDNYFVKVTAWAGSTGGYDLDVDFEDAQLPDTFEPNEDIAGAEATTKTVLSDPSIHKDDVDYYSITVPEGNTSLEAKLFGSETLDATIQVFDADGTELRMSDRNGVNENETISVDGLTGGQQLFVSVSGKNDTTGPYSLEFNYGNEAAGDLSEPNESYVSAFPLEIQDDRVKLIDLSVTDSEDRDFYSFIAPADTDGTATVSLKATDTDSTLNASLKVLDSAGTAITSVDANGAGESETLSLTGLVAGQTYYIDVNGWGSTGSYEMNVVTPLLTATAAAQQPTVEVTPVDLDPLALPSSAILANGSPAEIVVVEEVAGANDDDLSFGTTPVGTSLTFNIDVLNIGGSDLTVSSVALSGTDSSVFTTAWVDGSSGSVTIPAGQSKEIAVTFTPTATQLYSDATLTLNNDDSDEGTYAMTLTGTGSVSSSKPDINVTDTSASALSTLTFDNTNVDGESIKTFLINNDGSSSLTVTSAVISGDDADNFELVFANLANKTSDDYSIAADGQRSIQVAFKPIESGSLNAVLTLTSNDPDETTTVINLAGSSTEGNLVVDLTPTDSDVENAVDPTVNFGQAINDGENGQVATFPINLVNTGTSTLTISSITFGETDSPFSLTGAALDGLTIAAGETVSANITFDPIANGSFVDTMTVNSDDLDTPAMQFTLTGQAVQALTQTVGAGSSFSFTDSDGDVVNVQYSGSGSAELTFNGSSAEGSDLSGIAVTGGSTGGKLLVNVTEVNGDGVVNIDEIDIAETGFGTIDVDGSVDSIDVDGAVKTITVDGSVDNVDINGAVGAATIGGLNGDFDATSFKSLAINGNVSNGSITTETIKALTITGNVNEFDITTQGAKASLGAVNVTGSVDGLNITTGSIKSVNITGDVTDSDLIVSSGKGSVGAVDVTGNADIDITATSVKGLDVSGNFDGSVTTSGAKGAIGAVDVDGNMSADLTAVKSIKTIDVEGDVTSDMIAVTGSGKGKVGTVRSGGDWDVETMNVDGSIKAVTIGSATNDGDLLGELSADLGIKTVNIFGDILGDITANTKLGTISSTGSLGEDATITSTAGGIDRILIEEVLGDIVANGAIKEILRNADTYINPDTLATDTFQDHITGELGKVKFKTSD